MGRPQGSPLYPPHLQDEQCHASLFGAFNKRCHPTDVISNWFQVLTFMSKSSMVMLHAEILTSPTSLAPLWLSLRNAASPQVVRKTSPPQSHGCATRSKDGCGHQLINCTGKDNQRHPLLHTLSLLRLLDPACLSDKQEPQRNDVPLCEMTAVTLKQAILFS
jgi:hypothetical protein